MDDLEFVSTNDLVNELVKRSTWAGILIISNQEIKLKNNEQRIVPSQAYYQNMTKENAIECLQSTIDTLNASG
jgi:hypothetical protein